MRSESDCGPCGIIKVCCKKQGSAAVSPRHSDGRRLHERRHQLSYPFIEIRERFRLYLTVREASSVGLPGKANVQSGQSGSTSADFVDPEGESDVPSVVYQIILPGRPISQVESSTRSERLKE